MEISLWFILLFALTLIIGPFTQLLHLVAPDLHRRLGLMETRAFEPEFKWYLLEEKAIAIADMVYLITGLLFMVFAVLGWEIALIFGLYTCICYIYFSTIYIPRTILLIKHDLSPVSSKQLGIYLSYLILFLAFGLFGLVYLWSLV